MSYQQFLKELQDGADAALRSVSDEHHFFLEDGDIIKEASDEEKAESRSFLPKSKYDLSDGEYDIAVKIASELEQLTHSLSFQPCKDPDYHFLMKQAGLQISGEKQPEISLVTEAVLQKLASGEPLNALEELYTMSGSFQKIAESAKIAGVGDFLVRQGIRMGGKPVTVTREVVSKPWFGRIGSYATAAAPVVAGGAYLSGRASGAKDKEQQIANEIVDKLRYEASKVNAENQGY